MKKKRYKCEKGAAMLLALFTVIVIASIATGFLAITIAENKTTSSRIDSELALEAATAGIDYLAMVAASQQNFWMYGTLPGRRGSYSHPDFGNNTYFQPAIGGNFYLVYDLATASANGTNPPGTIKLLLGDRTGDGKIVGCNVIIHDDPDRYPDITATSVGFVINAGSTTPSNINIASTNNVFYASRSVQVILKEVSFYNYTYIYKNFTDLDLPFNVPSSYLTAMQNMVGLTPQTRIDGGLRADGYGDPNTDSNSNRVARLLLWNADGTPVTAAAGPIAQINGPVRLVSNDKYDGSGPAVVDNQIGNYNLNANMKRAFQGTSTITGAQQRGVPGANSTFMTNIRQATGGDSFSTPGTAFNIPTGGGSGTAGDPLKALSINNTSVFQDPQNSTTQREDLDHDGQKDYSKSLCRMRFSTDTNNKTVVTVDVYNRYNSSGPGGIASGEIDTMFNNPGQYRISTKTYTLDQDAVIYVRGGNTLVEGEIGSGISVVCDDSRTDPANVTGSIDSILPDPNSYGNPAANTQAAKDKFFRNLEKDNIEGTPATEGNIFITGDVTYKDGTTSAMGLISENYMYLHELNSSTADTGDNIPSGSSDYRHLQLRAQLNSIRQSVQFDFFNYLGESRSTYFNTGAGAANFNGSLDFKGQMVGNQTDVEGDTVGRGYASNMKIGYDESLKYYTAPMFFNENYTQTPVGTLQFTVTAFFDKGSLGSK